MTLKVEETFKPHTIALESKVEKIEQKPTQSRQTSPFNYPSITIDDSCISPLSKLTKPKLTKTQLHQEILLAIHCSENSANTFHLIHSTNSISEKIDSQNNTPIFWAAVFGKTELLSQLLKYGAQSGTLNRLNETILHFAVQYLNPWMTDTFDEILRIIDGSIMKICDLNGNTFLHYVCGRKITKNRGWKLYEEPIRKLVDQEDWTKLGVDDVESSRYYLRCIVEYLLQNPKWWDIVDMKNEMGETPLHLACRFGDPMMVELLMRVGANRKLLNVDGLTPQKGILLWRVHSQLEGKERIILRKIHNTITQTLQSKRKLAKAMRIARKNDKSKGIGIQPQENIETETKISTKRGQRKFKDVDFEDDENKELPLIDICLEHDWYIDYFMQLFQTKQNLDNKKISVKSPFRSNSDIRNKIQGSLEIVLRLDDDVELEAVSALLELKSLEGSISNVQRVSGIDLLCSILGQEDVAYYQKPEALDYEKKVDFTMLNEVET
ncbi:hypothetical protein HK096_005667 [Nowakowskiella sp. JEL0078]|nr:hypothetical protein HK096_005667 [Nowakowskiella sp. JEL0078]